MYKYFKNIKRIHSYNENEFFLNYKNEKSNLLESLIPEIIDSSYLKSSILNQVFEFEIGDFQDLNQRFKSSKHLISNRRFEILDLNQRFKSWNQRSFDLKSLI